MFRNVFNLNSNLTKIKLDKPMSINFKLLGIKKKLKN